MTEDEIMTDLAGFLRDFNGRRYRSPITPQTRFAADLGLASIDAIVLSETIEEHYGRKFPFADFMADLGRREQRDIPLGDLVTFLHRHLNG